MLNDGFANLYRDPQLVLWPAIAIALTCVALTLFANALRDELERSTRPRRSRRRRLAAGTTTAASAVSVLAEPELDDTVLADTGPADLALADPATDAGGTIVHEEPPGGPAPLLSIRNLAVGYPQPDGSVTRVVRDVSLDIRPGEVHGLIGESGSGKTQTAWSVLRLLAPGGQVLAGSITLD
jgi:ABC-type multidrug transport system fused ATPase/permease subunit